MSGRAATSENYIAENVPISLIGTDQIEYSLEYSRVQSRAGSYLCALGTIFLSCEYNESYNETADMYVKLMYTKGMWKQL